MSNQSKTFSWTAPEALRQVASDPAEARQHPAVLRALRAEAVRRGLDPETVQVLSTAVTPEGIEVRAEARAV
jgi:hypothetical protein